VPTVATANPAFNKRVPLRIAGEEQPFVSLKLPIEPLPSKPGLAEEINTARMSIVLIVRNIKIRDNRSILYFMHNRL
jgi:hypothetical protein